MVNAIKTVRSEEMGLKNIGSVRSAEIDNQR